MEDLFCPEASFKSIQEDFFFGGKNNWTILSSKKKDFGGWKMEIQRKLLTKDKKFDEQLLGVPSRVFYGMTDSSQEKYIPESYGEFELAK